MALANSKQIKLAVASVIILIGCAVAYRIFSDRDSDIKVEAPGGFGVSVSGAGGGGESGQKDGTVGPNSKGSERSSPSGIPKQEAINKPGAQFDRLLLPQGYVYYSINTDDEATRDGSLARLSEDEYPVAENIQAGDVLQSTNTKTIRTKPFGAASGKEIPRDTCFKVLSGSRKKIVAPAPIKSAAWIPTEIVTCPTENAPS
jgi:hypothetical protein